MSEEITKFSADDIDNEKNSTVVYTLYSRTQGEDTYFRIDDRTGQVFLEQKIDVSNKQINFIEKIIKVKKN